MKKTKPAPPRRAERALRRKRLGLKRLRQQPGQRRGAVPAQRGRLPEPDVEAGLHLDRRDRRADLPPRPLGQGLRLRGVGCRGGGGTVELDDGAGRGRGEGRDGGLGDVGRGEEEGLLLLRYGVFEVWSFFFLQATRETVRERKRGRNALCVSQCAG